MHALNPPHPSTPGLSLVKPVPSYDEDAFEAHIGRMNAYALIETLAAMGQYSEGSKTAAEARLQGYLKALYKTDEGFKALLTSLLTFVWHAAEDADASQ